MMNRQGPPPQSMRAMSGFPNQTGPQSRASGPLGSGRLQQNSKVANGPGWGFGMQNGAAPGLAAPQARALSNNASSFAQTIGSSQSSAPLDLSEFPSLSGGPQPQYQNQSQAVWSNQRANVQTPVGRPQPPGNSLGSAPQQQSSSQQAQEHAQQNLDEAFFPPNNMNGTLDDYRHGGQGGVGQLSGSGQPQPNSIDDFPPLGRLGPGEIGQDRRAAMMQNAAGGPFPGSSAFGSAQSGSRAVTDSLQQEQGKNGQVLPNWQTQSSNDASPQALQTGEQVQNLNQLPEDERYGLQVLLNIIRNPSSDTAHLAIGHNLSHLGLDLDSTDPLHPTFAGPFATAPARPLEPDFNLPQCYTVGNTHPLSEKLNGFSDESLLWIFYNMPRTSWQEDAAKELTERNWRFHKSLGQWLTKEMGVPEPQLIAHEVERGRYIVFNHRNWQRESREMIIRYQDLDDHITNPANRA